MDVHSPRPHQLSVLLVCDLPTRKTRNKSVSGQSVRPSEWQRRPRSTGTWMDRAERRAWQRVFLVPERSQGSTNMCVLRSLFESLRDSRTRTKDHRPTTVEPITTVWRRYRFVQVKTIGNSGLNSPRIEKSVFAVYFIGRLKENRKFSASNNFLRE